MKIVHTSDWHLGRQLYQQKRYEEFEQFLDWMIETIQSEAIEILLIAGDIFDTGTPSNKAQELYYNFLCNIQQTCCQHVIITAGNHDSPTLLDAPKMLLKNLNIHIVGKCSDTLDDELVLIEENNELQLIIAAVPYLSDRDIRKSVAGESLQDKNKLLLNGIKEHYHFVLNLAEAIKKKSNRDVPIIAMGHLFTAGGKTTADDGVRELYIGSLEHLPAETFPDSIDYLALGHLHVPQRVNKNEFRRYSGSPLPMNFGEAKQQKQVVILELTESNKTVTPLPIPCFQKLVSIKGDWQHIINELSTLKESENSVWLEIIYTGDEVLHNLIPRLDEEINDTKLTILKVENRRKTTNHIVKIENEETLKTLNEFDVFERCLIAKNIPPEQKEELTALYKTVIRNIQESDHNAK